jgi:hypothetical protein
MGFTVVWMHGRDSGELVTVACDLQAGGVELLRRLLAPARFERHRSFCLRVGTILAAEYRFGRRGSRFSGGGAC